jgi:hypothetical protein
VFLADGAITQEQLDESGGYATRLDHQAWHLYLTGKDGGVCACCTQILHPRGVEVEELRVYELLHEMEASRREPYASAIRSLLQQANDRNIRFGEAAAWAVEENIRHRRGSMMIAVAGWSLLQTLGHALVIAAPTLRHHTSSIERRLGGFPLTFQGSPLGLFHAPSHRCDMEFVWFDTERPLPKFAQFISEMRAHFEELNACPCKTT